MNTSYYKLDLHTHSRASTDGSITLEQYRHVLKEKVLDYVAITDHNTVDFALMAKQKLGDRIIVGEEIKSLGGDIIGLFLNKTVPGGLSIEETIKLIKEQEGVVYIPHPFTHNRSGIGHKLSRHQRKVDIVENFNPRNLVHSDNSMTEDFVKKAGIPSAVSSDAHCYYELGKTYTKIKVAPSRGNIVQTLANAEFVTAYTPLYHLLCPKKNTLIKLLHLS